MAEESLATSPGPISLKCLAKADDFERKLPLYFTLRQEVCSSAAPALPVQHYHSHVPSSTAVLSLLNLRTSPALKQSREEHRLTTGNRELMPLVDLSSSGGSRKKRAFGSFQFFFFPPPTRRR